MSRIRSTSVVWPGSVTSDFGYTRTFGIPSSTGNIIKSGYHYWSEITDELTPKGTAYTVNPCTHRKYSASVLNGSIGLQYVPHSPAYGDECVLNYRCAIRLISFSYTLPGCDWAALAAGLADSLNGRIDEGTLLGVTVAEARKTYRMIRNPFNLMKANWRSIAGTLSAAKLAKAGANIWLEGKYGWKSTYHEIKNIAKTSSKIFGDGSPGHILNSESERYAKGTSSPISFPSSDGYIYNPGDNQAAWNYYYNGFPGLTSSRAFIPRVKLLGKPFAVFIVSCRQKTDCAQRWSRSKRFLNAYGLDSSSILSTLWELVPYSFVVDWFVDSLGIWNPSIMRRLQQADVKGLCSSIRIKFPYQAELCLIGPQFIGYPATYARDVNAFTGNPICIGTPAYYHKYMRYAGLPPGVQTFPTIFTSKGLSLSQKASGLSLLVQRCL